MKRDVKDLVDHIVDELGKDSRVSALYQEWDLWQKEITLSYKQQTEELPPLSKQPKLKSIRNMVIAEALKLGSYHILFEEEETGLEASNDWTEQEPEQVEEMTEEEDTDSEHVEEEIQRMSFSMVEKEHPVLTGGRMDTSRQETICMAVILCCRILKRHIRNFFRKQNRGMGLPCRILGECLQMV